MLAFDGTSETTSLGFRLDLGAVLGTHWAAGLHASRAWSDGRLTVLRPGPRPLPVASEPSTEITSAKAELMGRYAGADLTLVPDFLTLAPRLAAYLIRTSYDSVINSLGETGTGPFGNAEALVMLAAGMAVGFDLGRGLTPDSYLGVDHELPGVLGDVLADQTGIALAASLSYGFARSARVSLSYTYARSTGARRTSGEIDLVAVLDF